MTTLEKARGLLNRHPGLRHHETATSITVEARSSTGFSVSLWKGMRETMVCFDGWHASFEDDDEALRCFELGLGDRCRLRVYRRWGIDYRWTLERLTPSGWEESRTVGLLLYPPWGTLDISHRQNTAP